MTFHETPPRKAQEDDLSRALARARREVTTDASSLPERFVDVPLRGASRTPLAADAPLLDHVAKSLAAAREARAAVAAAGLIDRQQALDNLSTPAPPAPPTPGLTRGPDGTYVLRLTSLHFAQLLAVLDAASTPAPASPSAASLLLLLEESLDTLDAPAHDLAGPRAEVTR